MVNIYTKTKEIEEFFDAFGERHREYSWDLYVKKFIAHPNYNKERKLLLDVYIRAFLAYHRTNIINELKENGKFVISRPKSLYAEHILKEGYSGKYYAYSRDGDFMDGLEGECDSLTCISRVPVLINFFYKKFPEEENERSEVFMDIFRDKLGYGIIATKDRLGKRSRNFKKRGGIVVALPFKKEELKSIVRNVCIKHELKTIEYLS